LFFAKSPCRKIFPKKSTKISMTVFPRLFLFYRVFGCFSAMGVQAKTLQKMFCKKNRVEKFVQKNRPKIQNRCFLDFLYHFFGRFWVRGVQKHEKKISENKSEPIPFSYSHPPTHHGGHRLFFGRPLGAGPARIATPGTQKTAKNIFVLLTQKRRNGGATAAAAAGGGEGVEGRWTRTGW
jgi:hypothetical protein